MVYRRRVEARGLGFKLLLILGQNLPIEEQQLLCLTHFVRLWWAPFVPRQGSDSEIIGVVVEDTTQAVTVLQNLGL